MRTLLAAFMALSISTPAVASGCWNPLSGDTEMSISVGQEEFAFGNLECAIAAVEDVSQIYRGACFNTDGGITRVTVDENGETAEVTLDNGPVMPYRRCD